MKGIYLTLLIALPINISSAGIVDDMGSYVGYTIVAVKKIAGYRDSGGKRADEFEGCEYGRTILFDDGTGLTCSGYHYHYKYHPSALLLMRSSEFQGNRIASVVMIVDDEAYDMSSIVLR